MYLNHFGFSEEPFSLTPDPHFLYLSPNHKEVLSSMGSVIKERKGTVTITGEVGTGKTTLIYSLLKTLDENTKIAFVFNSQISIEDLLKTCLRELGLNTAENNLYALLQIFNLYLRERLPLHETVAIIIDEAQNLNTEVLKGLTRLSRRETPASKLLQIILVGQPELEKNLDSPELEELKERIAIRHQVFPLGLEDSKAYIDHRLKIAGSSSSKVFTEDAVKRICKFAKGIPRVINHLCTQAFLTGYALSSPKIDSNIIKQVIKKMPHLNPPRLLPFPNIRPIYKILGFASLVVFGVGFFFFVNQIFRPNPALEQPLLQKSITLSLEKPAMDSHANKPAIGPVEWKTVKIQEGWSLSRLAKQYYHSEEISLLDIILEANPRITDTNRIRTNEEIKIPIVTEESLLIHLSDQTYNIHLGTFNDSIFLKNYENQAILKGKKLQIIQRKVSPKETWYRISAGSYDTREEGLEAIRILKGKGLLPALSHRRDRIDRR